MNIYQVIKIVSGIEKALNKYYCVCLYNKPSSS